MPLIFLLNGVTSFPDPGDWDPVNNKVECLGSGYPGQASQTGGPLVADTADVPVQLTLRNPGGGGGGGGYGIKNGSNPAFPVKVNIIQPAVGNAGGDGPNTTFWNEAAGAYAHEVYGAPGDTSGMGGLGGAGGNGTTYRGGTGGAGGAVTGTGGAGGGGAAGPHGAGATGAAGTGGAAGGAGGAGDNGTTPPSGIAGTQWDASHGCGSGGAGGTSSVAGGAGGAYGGAGGGQFGNSTAPVQGAGQNGLLVITYTSLPKINYAIIMS